MENESSRNSQAQLIIGGWVALIVLGAAFMWYRGKKEDVARREKLKKYKLLPNDIEAAPHTSAKYYSETTDTSRLTKFKEGIRTQFRYLSSDSSQVTEANQDTSNLASEIATSKSVETLYSNTYQEVMNDLIKLDEDTQEIGAKIESTSQSESDQAFVRRLKDLQKDFSSVKDTLQSLTADEEIYIQPDST
ncbi:unnamed protein product [Oikopleura dioica]|uniref:Uncharacterized protein n=1 Tax=Oikopleura dioica TaxID=34765 RepID=E4Y470_OIKDI|nr:unnamed protein product [Oikopleura dioica]